jgi:hypothetical protein
MGAIVSMSVHHGIPSCPPKLFHFPATCVFFSKLQDVAKKKPPFYTARGFGAKPIDRNTFNQGLHHNGHL